MDQFSRGHPYFSKNSGEMLKVKPEPPGVQHLISSFESQILSRQRNEIPSNAPKFETTLRLEPSILQPHRFKPENEITNIQNVVSPESSLATQMEISSNVAIGCEKTAMEAIHSELDKSDESSKGATSVGSMIQPRTSELTENSDSLTEEKKQFIQEACFIPEPELADKVPEKDNKFDEIWSDLSKKITEEEGVNHVDKLFSDENLDSTVGNKNIENPENKLDGLSPGQPLMKQNSICSNSTKQAVDGITTDYENDEKKQKVNEMYTEMEFVYEKQIQMTDTTGIQEIGNLENESDDASQQIIIDSNMSEPQESSIKERYENFENQNTLSENEKSLIEENNHFFESSQDSVLPDTREVMSWSKMLSEHQVIASPEISTPRISESDIIESTNEFDSLIGDFEIIDDKTFQENEEIPETI